MSDTETIKAVATLLRLTHVQDDGTRAHILDSFELFPPGAEDHPRDKWTLYLATLVPGRRPSLGDPGDPDDALIDQIGEYEKLDDALIEIGRRVVLNTIELATADEL